MAENIQRNKGRGQGYKFDRGGTPSESGPFIGVVKNNIDTLRSGRLQVYIEEFGGGNEDDSSLWRTVAYLPPYYGEVEQTGTDKGSGEYIGNPQSYGMWFTPPDLGVKVLCFFASGDPNQGYYTGCVPTLGVNHMIPAIGSSKHFTLPEGEQAGYLKDAKQLPVTEINVDNDEINENPKFYDQSKPVHSYLAAVLLQQGLINDPVRGPITSSAQRESPSAVCGFSTPGRVVTNGGVNETNVRQKAGSKVTEQDIKVVGRRGGHSIVLDDGDIDGYDNLIRIRTGKGHQITMSDDGDCFYITHANGQTWLEFGTEGTVDVYATNSINLRSQGDINLHADRNINMYAGREICAKSKVIAIESEVNTQVTSGKQLTLFSDNTVNVGSTGAINIHGQTGGWKSNGLLSFKGSRIDLNSSSTPQSVSKPDAITPVELPDVVFDKGTGWTVVEGKLSTIVTRAPTHEPYPYHNRGVEQVVSLDSGSGSATSANSTATSAASVPLATSVAQEPVATVDLTTATPPYFPSQLDNVPVTTPVDPAQIIKQEPAATSIANLNIPEVTGLLASRVAEISQASSLISVAKGIGSYGLTPVHLQQLGLIKPGTIERYGKENAILMDVLQSPSLWTGIHGVRSISDLTDNPQLQTQLQQDLMRVSYNAVQRSGVLSGSETPAAVAGLVQTAVAVGPAGAIQWAAGTATAAIVQRASAIAKNAQQAVMSIINNSALSRLGGFGINIAGAIDTVLRNGVNTAVVNVIANAKVLPPTFAPVERVDPQEERIDIASIQRAERNRVFTQALANGATEQEADTLANEAGNLAGAAALGNLNRGQA